MKRARLERDSYSFAFTIDPQFVAEIHFDGSYTEFDEGIDSKADFGIAIGFPGAANLLEFVSPVSLDTRSADFRGANYLLNNVAELTGATFALEVAASRPSGRIRIC